MKLYSPANSSHDDWENEDMAPETLSDVKCSLIFIIFKQLFVLDS